MDLGFPESANLAPSFELLQILQQLDHIVEANGKIGRTMALTDQQKATLKAFIQADPVLNAFPNNSDGAFEIAKALNLATNPVVQVWRSDAPVPAIYDAINWAQYTPTWTPSATDTAATAILYSNALLIIQTKQMNLQLMTQGRSTVNASKVNVRTGLRDCVIQVPAGAISNNAASLVNPGGASGINVLNACVRTATVVENVLSVSASALGGVTARVMTFEGEIGYQDVQDARNS